MSSRKPKIPPAGTSFSRKSSGTSNTSAVSSISASSAASPIAIPTTSKGKKNLKAPDYCGFGISVCSVNDSETMPAPERQRPKNPVIETIKKAEALPPPAVEIFFELLVVSPPEPRIRQLVVSPPEKNLYADYEREVSISVFDAENQT